MGGGTGTGIGIGEEGYKAKFIEFLLKTGALRVGGDFSLKSKRLSPWFVNVKFYWS